MFRIFPSSSPGPIWEALQEPEPSDDELDTDEVDSLALPRSAQAGFSSQRATDGRTETARDPPQSAPPAFASTSINVVGDDSRSQMKRKESESLFNSKKRARYAQAARDAMNLDDLDGWAKNVETDSKSAPLPRTIGRHSLPVPSISMNRKQPLGSSPTSSPSTNAKPNLLRKTSGMKPLSFLPKRPSESAVADSNSPSSHESPPKLAALPFRRAESKTMPTSDTGRSMLPSSPSDKPVDKGKSPSKHRWVSSAPQTTRHLSTSAIPPDAEIIEISEGDESPLPSVSQAKSNSKSTRQSSIETLTILEQARRRSRIGTKTTALGSSPSPKKFFSKAPIEIIEIFDSDEEHLPAKALRNVGTSSISRLSELVQECATGSTAHRGQPWQMSSSGGDSSEGNGGGIDEMNVDEPRNLHASAADSDNYPDLFDIPSSHRGSSQEMQATDDHQATRGLIPLPSSSPSSIGYSPECNSPFTPPASATSTTSLTRTLLSQQPSTLTNSPNSVRKSITTSAGAGANVSSFNNRQGYSSVTVSSSLKAPPPADKRLIQLARKSKPRPMSHHDESSGKLSEREASQIKVDKGKGKEIGQPSSSSSDALSTVSDKPVKPTPILPKKGGQTLAEAITSAGQLNRTKIKMGRWLQGNTKDVPIDLTSDAEEGVKDGLTVDEMAWKAAIESSRSLVNYLPTLKERSSSTSGIATAKVIGPLASSSSQERKSSLNPPRMQDLHSAVEPTEKIERSSYPLSTERNIVPHDMSSQKPPPLPPAGMQLKSRPSVSVEKTFSATTQPQREQSTAYGFKSGIAVIGSPKSMPLLKRPSAAIIERTLPVGTDSSGASQQTSPTGTTDLSRETEESNGDVSMDDISSRKSISPMLADLIATSPAAATVMTTSSIPLPLSTSPVSINGSVPATPFKRPTLPKRFPLATTETMFIASTVPGDISSSTSSQQVPSTSTVGRSSGGTRHDDASVTVISSPKSHSPKPANVQPGLFSSLNDVRLHSLATVAAQPLVIAAVVSPSSQLTTITRSSGGEVDSVASMAILATKSPSPKSPKPLMVPISAEVPWQPTNDIIARDTAVLPSTALPSMDLPASSLSIIVPTSSSDTHARSLGLSSGDSLDEDEKECQALLQSPRSDYMDVVPSHDVQSSLQDNVVVRQKSHINLDTSAASSSTLTSTAEVFNDVSPPIEELIARRSSGRSSRSSTSEGLGIPFDDDFGPVDSVPATRTPTPEEQELSISSSLSSSPKTYGGFRALTWKNFRKDLNNFIPKSYYAKDLPHALQDHINGMSEYTQRMAGMRDLFKATILENTVEDEPDAPPIDILNNVDTQATPPWEFYYTNQMWLGEGVPPPDIKSLVGCTWKGSWNPRSKTWACLGRKREAVCNPLLEFAYDKNGKLKIPGYPIFECNDLCGCSDECRNRLVQHGRKISVNIAKTETKGWGVFAGAKKILHGTFIGIYSGELLMDAVADERGIKYDKVGRTYLFDVDFHHLKAGDRTWENSYTVDAYHAGNFTRFLNHSCDPNCRLYPCYINEGNIQKPLLAIFSRRDIEPYEEICFNYQGSYPDSDEDEDSEDSEDNDKSVDFDRRKDIVYLACRCGAKNCTGIMFK